MMLFKKLWDVSLSGKNALKKGATLEVETGATLKMNGANVVPSARIVTTTATALTLNATDHAEKVVLINTNSTVTNTFTLPAATGSGLKYTLINNVAQTQGTIKIAANGTDVLSGIAIGVHATTTTGGASFLTSATSDYYSFNRTTTGGLGQDSFEAIDSASGTWTVRVVFNGNGSLATGFAAT